MGSVSSSSNLANLLQTLQGESPQLSSILAAPNVQSALEKAPPGDLVQLSDQALQLQQVGLLFGSPDGNLSTGLSPTDPLSSLLLVDGSTTQPDPILQVLDSSLAAGGTNGAASSSAAASQIADSASSLQSQEMDALFGITPTQTIDPFINTQG